MPGTHDISINCSGFDQIASEPRENPLINVPKLPVHNTRYSAECLLALQWAAFADLRLEH
jgi:hypothetical protein